MRTVQNKYIIGVDHGYGNMKTANCCFPTGVISYETEPSFNEDLLVWNGRYYLIGRGHKEFTVDKALDDDFYVLTLVAIARELNIAKVYDADVCIAAGVPLTWVEKQKEDFKAYLLREEAVTFSFRRKEYRVRIKSVSVFPQGFAAVVSNLGEFTGLNMLCDIGNGTMNIMYINNKKPDPTRCFTEKFGTHQCNLQMREELLRAHGIEPPDELITQFLRFGTADMDKSYLETARRTAKEYVKGIFQRLREHGYDPRIMRLHVVGGGGTLIKHFGEYAPDRITIYEDICATAKGYERLMEVLMLREG